MSSSTTTGVVRDCTATVMTEFGVSYMTLLHEPSAMRQNRLDWSRHKLALCRTDNTQIDCHVAVSVGMFAVPSP